MNRKQLLLIICVLLHVDSFGQIERYISKENNYYWKNRKPYDGYWQQDVYYSIKARLDEKTNIIAGYEELTYKNNSPDTLHVVFFHLYQNAFQPTSYLDDLNKANNVKIKYNAYEEKGLGIEIENMQCLFINGISKNTILKTEKDNTILKVILPEGLIPGAAIVFSMDFNTYYDKSTQRRRMKMYDAWGENHYNGCQWFPKISVYDAHNGWDTNQHLGKEFYGNFGDFDVELTFANHYIVEATGVLINEKEMLPDDLRKKLDISNFKERPKTEKPSVIITPDGSTKTWKYHAENVHDFAFTADPSYRIGEVMWNGVRCIAIAQEPHCYGWQNAASYAAKIIEVYSRDIGMYGYPKMVVADARDGMEYPMLTLNNGMDPGYRYVFSHEIGHNWFYGMVGSNETYRAFLDEGFSQFLNTWCLENLEGTELKPRSSKWSDIKPTVALTQQYVYAYSGYLNAAISDEDGFINTHSDMFNSALGHGGGYGMVYRKTATMLYNLQYVLGDELFLKAMQHYFDKWKFCHPYPDDFRKSITEVVKYDLSWFFDQWLETDKKLDYKICHVKKLNVADMYEITFKRKGRMQSPIDFSVYSSCGAKYDYYIPNTWFQKQTDATILPKWEGWDKLRSTYKATVKIPCGISNVIIDTTDRLADVYRLDNTLVRPIKLVFDKWQKPPYNDWKNYVFYVRPDVWFNNYDGVKAGIHVESNYMQTRHIFSGDFWLNTAVGQNHLPENAEINKNDPASFKFFYKTPLPFIARNFNGWLGGGHVDGLTTFTTGTELFTTNRKTRLFAEYKLMYRSNTNSLDYLLYPLEWQSAKYNNNMTLGISKSYTIKQFNGSTTIQALSNSIYSDYAFSKLNLTNILRFNTGKIDWSHRLFLQYGNGGQVPSESALYLAGANPESLMESAFTRSRAFIPSNWLGYGAETNHFQQGGGLNLRGYAGYLVPTQKGNDQIYIYKGTSGASMSLEVEVDRLLNIKPKLTKNWLKVDIYLFADAGSINVSDVRNKLKLCPIKTDAGLGSVLTIKKWGKYSAIKPLSVRFDVPLFLNAPPAIEKDFTKFRFVMGIGRTF